MRRLSALLALGVCVLAATAGAPVRSQYVQTMTFQDGVAPTAGYSGSEFTFINSSAADSGKNFGAADTLYLSGAGYTGPFRAGQNKILWKFDIGALPDSAVIVEAKLYLYQRANNTGANADTVVAYRIFPPWTEGTGTGTASVASATWTTRHANDSPADVYTGGAWSANGASGVSAAGAFGRWWGTSGDSSITSTFTGSDTVDVKNSSLHSGGAPVFDRATEGVLGFAKTGVPAGSKSGWITIDLTHQVDLWHTGANTNNGGIVEMHSNTNNKVFPIFSDNYANLPYRPKLVVKYIDPEEIEDLAGSGGARRHTGRTRR
jgi:hypothetical protein